MKPWYVTAHSYEDGGFDYEIPNAEFCTKQQALEFVEANKDNYYGLSVESNCEHCFRLDHDLPCNCDEGK